MIMGSNFDFACCAIHYRLIDAAVTEWQFVCVKSKRTTKQLVSEANSKEGDFVIKNFA
jgi:hypothetical protein